jgi:hypothetical protein
MGASERIGDHPAVAHLTSATRLDPGAIYRTVDAVDLRADVEVAVELGRDVDPEEDAAAAFAAISGFCAALELVDLGQAADAEWIVATNIFHRAVAFGDPRPSLPRAVRGRLLVDGTVRDAAAAPDDLGERLHAAACVLAAVGEKLAGRDRVITGSIVQIPIGRGDRVVADLGALGSVELTIAP